MITRVRETEGGYKVTLLHADGIADSRETASLAEAFKWQAYASERGELPLAPKREPEVKEKVNGRS